MNLPSETFLIIREYFVIPFSESSNDQESWRNLLSCNKWFYHEINRKYQIYLFSVTSSLAYLRPSISRTLYLSPESIIHIEKVHTHISNPSLQVVLTFYPPFKSLLVPDYIPLLQETYGIRFAYLEKSLNFSLFFKNQQYLCLESQERYQDSLDLSKLRNVKCLTCSSGYCQNPSCHPIGLSSLTIKLLKLEGLSDVSVFADIRYLNLSNFYELKEV
jgi:hypothetical protein